MKKYVNCYENKEDAMKKNCKLPKYIGKSGPKSTCQSHLETQINKREETTTQIMLRACSQKRNIVISRQVDYKRQCGGRSLFGPISRKK